MASRLGRPVGRRLPQGAGTTGNVFPGGGREGPSGGGLPTPPREVREQPRTFPAPAMAGHGSGRAREEAARATSTQGHLMPVILSSPKRCRPLACRHTLTLFEVIW